ncbi:hypothetical protein [uncultured Algibacter sp.]|uniref:hypothetical protein n=1 Tax=uncultured Algibacter sp. TaxID=298659 RepID=UPI003216E289
MNLIKQLFGFYINSSIHVALSVYAMTWITLFELGLNYDESVLYFVFYATITGYNFVKYFGIAKFRHKALAKGLKLIQFLSFLSFILLCYYGYKLEFRTLVFLVGLGLLTFLYAIPFSIKKQLTLRNVSQLKIYIIALVWTGVTVFVPILNYNLCLNNDMILLGLQRFVFVIVLMFPFEIRDLKYDHLSLSTIPQRIGVKRTKVLGAILMLLFFIVEFLKDNINILDIAILSVITLITILLLVLSQITQRKYYSSFFVESIPIVWLLLILILS